MKPTYEELLEEVEALKDWRLLALQFDGHRMQAMSMLKMVATGNFDMEEIRQFIAAAPVSGNEHLRKVRADAVNKFAEHVFTGTDCLHVNLKAAANQYHASILAGKE